MGAGVEDAVGDPAHAHAVAVVVELSNGVVGAEARSAFGVADVEADHVAAGRLNLAPPANAQPYLSAGWPLLTQLPVAPQRLRGCGVVVGAAGVMQSSADAGEAPGLIDAQVGDDVRHPEAEAVTRPLLIVNALSLTSAPLAGNAKPPSPGPPCHPCGLRGLRATACRRSRCRTGRYRPRGSGPRRRCHPRPARCGSCRRRRR